MNRYAWDRFGCCELPIASQARLFLTVVHTCHSVMLKLELALSIMLQVKKNAPQASAAMVAPRTIKER